MHLVCPYSGVHYRATGFPQVKVNCPHPIMNANIQTILSRASNWSEGSLDDIERRLLFIALLKATEAFIFDSPAIPEKRIINHYMQRVTLVAGWKTKLGDRISLPQYHVTRDTYKLENIGQWLNRWEEERKRWEQYGTGPSDWDRVKALHHRIESLERLIVGPYKENLPRHQKRLGRTIMDMMPTPEGIKNHWIDIFNMRSDEEIFKAEQVDIEELLEFMEDNLEAGSSLAHIAFQVVRDILQKKKGGLALSVGMFDDMEGELGEYDLEGKNEFARGTSSRTAFSFKEYDELKSNPYIIIEETTTSNVIPLNTESREQYINYGKREERNIILKLTEDFPREEPKKSDFTDLPGRSAMFQWIKATSNWRIARDAMLKQKEELKKREEADKKALDFIEKSMIDDPSSSEETRSFREDEMGDITKLLGMSKEDNEGKRE